MKRRTFIKGLGGLFATGAMPANAQQQGYVFRPDFTSATKIRNPISGEDFEIDIDLGLLGPNGEKTAGYIASIDVLHGRAFSPGWTRKYGYLEDQGLLYSTNDLLLNNVKNQMRSHGIGDDILEGIYQREALPIWQKCQNLRDPAYPPPGTDVTCG